MTNPIYTWQQITHFVLGQGSQDIPGLSNLINLARKKGLGAPISYQKTEYQQSDLRILSPIIKWWQYLTNISLVDFGDKANTQAIQSNLMDSVLNNQSLTVYSIFCPSYKKGLGALGYTGITGKHTRQLLQQLIEFIYHSNSLGVSTQGIVYFSDLLLENYPLLQTTSYQDDLQKNYQDFSKIIAVQDPNSYIQVHLLSEIPELKVNIGEEGIVQGPLNVPEEVKNIVLARNKIFYKTTLGWTDAQVETRTEVLARCYAYMGEIFRQVHPKGIMFWVESAYERGKMYCGIHPQPIPIIYPIKYD